VIWQSSDGPGDDTAGGSIQGQRYDSNGAAEGDQFQMNTYTTNLQRRPAVVDAGGTFVVVWESLGSFGTDTSSYSVQAQFVAASTTSSSTSLTTSSTMLTPTSTTTTSTTMGTTTTTLAVIELMPGKIAIVRFGSLAKFVAKPTPGGPTFFPPQTGSPLSAGGSLRIFDTAATAGDVTYSLPGGAAWKGLGNPPETKGYKYKGAGTPSDPCRVVLWKRTVVKAVCKGTGVTLQPPFTGQVGIDLRMAVSDHYCAAFGGNDTQNDATGLKRTNAPAPGACP